MELVSAASEVTLVTVARGAMKNNNYLVADPVSGGALLIDPAWEIGKLQDAVAASGARLAGILLTHAHPDHIDLARPLSDAHDCPIWMAREEIDASGFRAPRLIEAGKRPFQAGGMMVRPLLTPGHTPGSTCYLVGADLFAGDVLFNEGCGVCPGDDAAGAMFDSLAMLKATLAPHTRIHPGHTYVRPPGQTFASVLATNVYLHFEDRDKFIGFRMRRGQSTASLLKFA